MDKLSQLSEKVNHHLSLIYDGLPVDKARLTNDLLKSMRLSHEHDVLIPQVHTNLWDEKDVVLITYGDSIIEPSEELAEGHKRPPLKTLYDFLQKYCTHTINNVHILPFFPYSSDDGFSVIDYSSVNQSLGTWDDITNIANEFGLMLDLVINHCSSRSHWFENFIEGKSPGKDFFYTADENTDTSAVTRPRSSPLLRETKTADGIKHVWCTFSHDQVDFDFRNPDVLVAFTDIIRLYLDKGTRIFRLDAIAFLWKELGTNCINLPQTHEVVRLIRTLIEHASPNTIMITETNIPNAENLTYFGNANEAHALSLIHISEPTRPY